MTNSKLKAVYNGSEIITSNGFIMQSRFILPVLSRMQTEKLLSKSGAEVVQAILAYKFDERKPFPTFRELADYLGKAERTIKEGVASIRQCGILGIKKVNETTGEGCNNNVYDFAPFFALLEKFIQVFHIEKRKDVTISELLKMKVKKKVAKTKSFEWAKEVEGTEKEVVAVPEVAEEPATPTPAPATPEEPVVPACVLPENIKNIVEFYNIQPEGIVAIEKAYASFSATLDDIIFIDKIVASSGKTNFVNYFNTCITKAYATKEQPKQAKQQEAPASTPAPRKKAYNKPAYEGRREITPEWFDRNKSKLEEKQRIAEEIEARKSVEQKIKETASEAELQVVLSAITVTPEIQSLVDAHRVYLQELFDSEREKVLRKIKGIQEPQEAQETIK